MSDVKFIWGFSLFIILLVSFIGFIPIETENQIYADDGGLITDAEQLNIFEKVGLFYRVAFFGFDTDLVPQWLASIIVFPLTFTMIYLMILIGKDLIPFT